MSVQADTAALQAELEAARRKLAEIYKMASLGRLVAGILHEINTPLGSIFSNNEVAIRSLETLRRLLADAQAASEPPPAKASQLVETLRGLAAIDKSASERVLTLIRSVKTYARVDESDLRTVDLKDLLEDALTLSGSEYRRRVRMETDFGQTPLVECYPQLLGQAFLNLLVNAGQAIPGEGKITVRTRLEGNQVRISVEDTGQGIRPEDREKIFQRGFTTKPPGIGTGLGLSITREIIVEKHGGSIEFESEPGRGTTFHVRIPLRQRRTEA